MAQPPSQNSPDRTPAWIAAGLAATLTLLGCVFAGVGVRQARREEASRSWPTTEAIVIHSGEHTYVPPGHSDALPQQSSAYRYTVGGRSYEFRRSGYLGQGAPLPPASRVLVRYDPGQPEEHAFDAERTPHRPIFEWIGALCVLLSAPLWYLAKRLRGPSRGTPAST